MYVIFLSGSRREVQNCSAGFISFPISSMKDFPIPEDPPVTMTAENDESASLTEGTKLSGTFFARPVFPAGFGSTQT